MAASEHGGQPALEYDNATIKRNDDTWDAKAFAPLRNRRMSTNEVLFRLVSTHPGYSNVDAVRPTVTFGRREGVDVRIADPAVSGRHCRVWIESAEDAAGAPGANDTLTAAMVGLDGHRVMLEDLSTNGTFVGDRRVGKGQAVEVTSGTEIVLIPRGEDRMKVSFILYVPSREKQEAAPEGRVTFVFTDVQSSTSLWEHAPVAMNEALELHDRVMRRFLRKCRGYEVKTEGDAFLVCFFRPVDAVRWALEVQRALLEVEWPAGLLREDAAREERAAGGELLYRGVRVRMGIHVGEPAARRNPVTGRMDYFGPVMNRTARVSDSAHGGQVVMTPELAAELEASRDDEAFAAAFPGGVRVADLGTHAYKGIKEPVQVFQVCEPALAGRSFGALRTAKVASKGLGARIATQQDIRGAEAKDPAGALPTEPISLAQCSRPGCEATETLVKPFGACARCKRVKYCSVDCQRSHWRDHKPECRAPVVEPPTPHRA